MEFQTDSNNIPVKIQLMVDSQEAAPESNEAEKIKLNNNTVEYAELARIGHKMLPDDWKIAAIHGTN